MAEQNRKIFLPPFLCSFSVIVAGSQSTSRCDFATCVCAPYCLSSPPFLFIILEVWTLLAVTCAHNDLAEDHQRERRERDRHSHKSKSNKTFKTNKCQGIFRGGLWRTQRNQYCRKRMYCKSDNKGRINLKARKIFKQKIKQEKKKYRKMQRVAWGIYIWYTTHHNPHFIPIQILHSSYFMNACVRGEWERGLRLYLSPFYSCFSPYYSLLLSSFLC